MIRNRFCTNRNVPIKWRRVNIEQTLLALQQNEQSNVLMELKETGTKIT